MRICGINLDKHNPKPPIAVLENALKGQYEDALGSLKSGALRPGPVKDITQVLVTLAEARTRLAAAAPNGQGANLQAVNELIAEVNQKLYLAPADWTRLGLSRMLALLATAAIDLAPQVDTVAVARIIIPAELLFQARQALFPAERMQVVAGRRHGSTVQLSAPFDVTGECSGSHVRADNAKVNDALVGMTRSGGFLAMWLHSHPGEGPAATHPSMIDRTQHQEWLEHYWPNLLGAIMVRDGFCRLFGDAVEQGVMDITIQGIGVELIKEETNGSGKLYRIG